MAAQNCPSLIRGAHHITYVHVIWPLPSKNT